MAKTTRETLARLFLFFLLVFLGAITLFSLSFKEIGTVVAILEVVDGFLWLSTLLP